jgi:hypothetical protein
MMRNDFAALILTHGRPDRVYTYDSLMRSGYTGRWYIVIDDEDKTAGGYIERFGKDHVVVFSKAEIAARIDEGNNFQDRRAIVYARNACWDIAEKVGVHYFMQLDDDYTNFQYRSSNKKAVCGQRILVTMDKLLSAMIDFFEQTQALAVAMLQGGDYIGYGNKSHKIDHGSIRKCMNSWLCSVDRKFSFQGTMNEDATAYSLGGLRGNLFLSIPFTCIGQVQTQASDGVMSEVYARYGTYVKTMYSVIAAPSCCKVSLLRDPRSNNAPRIHHRMIYDATYPKIVREELAKS